jgi:Predicted membrane protein
MIKEENLTLLTDYYEITMANGYFQSGVVDDIAYFDMFFRVIPDGGGYAIMAGIEQVVNYLKNLEFTDEDIEYLRSKHSFCDEFLDYLKNFKFVCDVWAVPEGMIVGPAIKNRTPFDSGIKFTSKKILQWAVILLGFGLNLSVIAQTGKQSLPIIVCTITTSLVIAWMLHKAMKTPAKISTLIGVGSSICGGSAIAATATVIDADDEEVAQSISVIFFFNVIAAVLFPVLGHLLGFDTTSGEAFGVFAGTAINDTSSVTAAAATWDSMPMKLQQQMDFLISVKRS